MSYAASSGDKQFPYPWGNQPSPSEALASFCKYGAGLCDFTKIPSVGSHSPMGDGSDGRLADLAGSMWEWALDNWSPQHQQEPCYDCGYISNSFDRSFRGGSWQSIAAEITSTSRSHGDAMKRFQDVGVRCAQDPL